MLWGAYFAMQINNESPNIADAIAMGIWRVMTYTPKQNTTENYALAHGGVKNIQLRHRWF